MEPQRGVGARSGDLGFFGLLGFLGSSIGTGGEWGSCIKGFERGC